MTDREFWILVRRALLIIVQAIERKYCLSKTVVDLQENQLMDKQG